ncbi:MAG: DNA-binding response regulator [Myxococcales bacterium]|nr:DNA-binding response regulator [Myxococcales bacterium]
MYPFVFVEDDPLVAKSMMRCFADTKYGATWVTTVADARAELATRRDLTGIVSDYHLPDGTGLELVLEARERIPGLPAVLTTGDSDGEVNNRATGSRIPLLRKPFDPDALAPFYEDMIAFERSPFGPRVTNLALESDLSSRELEALRRALGNTSLEASAAEMGISAHTLRGYRRQALRKLRASSFAVVASRLGLVDPAD